LDLAGQPVLRRALASLCGHAGVSAVRAVIRPEDRVRYDLAAAGLVLLDPVAGGASRQESARLGLESLSDLVPEIVLIHDGARPFVDGPMVSRALAALAEAPAALPALPVGDTLKRSSDGEAVAGTVDRAGLWRAQTPQAFRYRDILAAHRAAAGRSLTDDAAVAEAAGLAVRLVPGSEDNFKITTADDLARARRMLAAAGEVRIGQGLDVHGFGPGESVMLCGVRIAHERGLVGHSDADVGLHAATDAIIGALGVGDIGMHFPPSDPQWRGASSDTFLRHAGSLVAARGGEIVNLDVTLVCEAPRIGAHRAAMVARIASILGVDPGRISVKATTTEGLGFTGRREGIAAQAVASVRLPSP
ncbi:MAG TPA: bifunctional 2-C-methyl-D-erythritol 4-phosphate cytidylyltransferase/2-C-methyl-D-erythritol 2,4-cyclodiphosphate synthase, partial [Alphaproteobacteria bacterium]